MKTNRPTLTVAQRHYADDHGGRIVLSQADGVTVAAERVRQDWGTTFRFVRESSNGFEVFATARF
jgi:hypothetical protein